MSPFIETICIENGVAHNLPYHTLRMNATRRAIYGAVAPIDLSAVVRPAAYGGCTKCRIEYAEDIIKVEYAPYSLRPVHSLRLISCDTILYDLKSTDRTLLNALFALREEADDILIVRHGLLTDTSICNIALWDGKVWVTPAHPLLCGTMRASLLDAGTICPGDIRPQDLPNYSRVRLFNAMIGFGKVDLAQTVLVQ